MGNGVTVAWQLGFMSMPAAPDLIQPISLCLILATGSTWYLEGCCMVADDKPRFTQVGLGEDTLGWDASRPEEGLDCRLGLPSRATPRAEWRARRRSWCRGVPHTSQQLSVSWPLGGHSRPWRLSRRRPAKLESYKKWKEGINRFNLKSQRIFDFFKWHQCFYIKCNTRGFSFKEKLKVEPFREIEPLMQRHPCQTALVTFC